MSKYRIEMIGSEKFDLLIPLMRDCFAKDVNIEYFQWKYIENPAGSFIGFIAVENETNEVGAYYGVIPQRFIIEGKERTIYQSCDTMTHSNHRRQGLFKMLALECYDYLRKNGNLFIIGFGGADSTPGFIKFGWKHSFNFRYYFKPALLCKITLPGRFSLKDFSDQDITANLNSFLQQTESSPLIHSARTREHILWRSRNNHFKYQFFFYRPNGITQGYALYYINNNKLILFDFIFNNKKSRKAILWFLARKVAKDGYQGLIAYCQEQGKYAKLLKRSGFISNPFKKGPLTERTPFIFYADEDVMNKYTDASKWQITSYDHDAL